MTERARQFPLFQVDAFASTLFRGNPAAVMPLEDWLADGVLQAIALENNLSETAFFIPTSKPSAADFELRWFTPAREVELCGHATLASAHVLMQHLGFESEIVRFTTRHSGLLSVIALKSGDVNLYELDFPASPATPVQAPKGLDRALGVDVRQTFRGRHLMVVIDQPEQVQSMKPDLTALLDFEDYGFIVTAPAAPNSEADYVSRFFAPKAGVPEDPATGSAQCTLAPYWANRLEKDELVAHQLSARRGEFFCRVVNDRAKIAGQAITYLSGQVHL